MSWYSKMTKKAYAIDHEFDFIEKKRWEEDFFFASNKRPETSYEVIIMAREVDNNFHDPYWMVNVSGFSFEAGNMIYKKIIYFKKRADAKSSFDTCCGIIKEMRHEQEANNLPLVTLPSMLWHALHDIDGDINIKAKDKGNIIYLRQDHNINDNRGNLLKNILYLDKANHEILENNDMGGAISDRANYF
jgi:hypothetical protein